MLGGKLPFSIRRVFRTPGELLPFFDGPALPLSRCWAGDEKPCIYLVSRFDAFHLCSGGDFEEVASPTTSWELGSGWSVSADVLREFLKQVDTSDLDAWWVREVNWFEVAREKIYRGELVGVRQAKMQSGKAGNTTTQHRRLVHAIGAASRGRISEGGRDYKLCAGADLSGIADRDNYSVVGRNEARRVLEALAKQATGSELATLLLKARDGLSPDWRRPFTPNGMVLLCKSAKRRFAASSSEAAMTPSQLRAALESEKSLQFFARFVDERGEPAPEFRGQLEHGDDPEIDMAFSGEAFACVGEMKGERSAWLTCADQVNQDLVKALKKRWAKIRGETDDDWKKKEQCLVEVLFKEGQLPELELEAEKKHTFMLRPPVAVARMHGMYFDTNKCFLLPGAVASLKRLVETRTAHPNSEVLIVGHTDTAGSEAFNLDLSADRADALKAFLRDDADTWLAWYDEGVRESKRWGRHEDLLMIDALVPEEEFGGDSHVEAYQQWHNGEAPDARMDDEVPGRSRPDGWEELKVDGILGPKTRRQLILDYMNLDGTSLPADVRIVTYGCGEYFPLEGENDEVAEDAKDGEDVPSDRRAEVFLFARPFGILPPVPGVGEGASSKRASKAAKGDGLYPEWRRRATRQYAIDIEAEDLHLRLYNAELVPFANRPFAFCLEGYPEIRGTTDADGFANLDPQPVGAKGYIRVWPDDASPDATVSWDITIGPIISAATPLGASTRLANLGYFSGKSTEEMTDDLCESIMCFQSDYPGLDVNGELTDETCAKLREINDDEPANTDSDGGGDKAGDDGTGDSADVDESAT